MKSFKAFLLEETFKVPFGVFIYKDKIIVGVNHGNNVKIGDKSLVNKIKDHGDKHGYFYEGDGKDAKQPLFGLGSMKDYKSGYDKDFNKSLKQFPYEMVSVIAANTKINKPYEWVAKAGENGKLSIFDALIKADMGKMLDLPKLTPQILEKFFKQIDMLDAAKNTKATKENSKKFVTDMEKEGYEHKNKQSEYDWKNPSTKLQKVSQEAEDLRNNYILDKASPGVYIIGAGHIESMKRILDEKNEDYEMIGGEKIE